MKKSYSKGEDYKKEKTIEEEELMLLNLLYAPKGSKLHSLAKLITRIEKLSYVLAWSKVRHRPWWVTCPNIKISSDFGS
mgnify:CR=1 FL=1